MDFKRAQAQYMVYCRSRHLRPRTMISYEQTLVLFSLWMEENHGVTQVEAVREVHIRQYIIDLQTRGKYRMMGDFLMLLVRWFVLPMLDSVVKSCYNMTTSGR